MMIIYWVSIQGIGYTNIEDIISFRCRHSPSQEIYHCLVDQRALTVVIGAKCSDGIVLVADRKITLFGRGQGFEEKIRGDLAHVLIEYAGDVNMFDIFRKYIVGDVVIRRSGNAYTSENLVYETAQSVKRFNELICKNEPIFEVIMGIHNGLNSELHYIDFNGNYTEVNYKAIGSGAETADIFCASLPYDRIKMRDFLKHAYLAIMFMDKYCSGLGVGIESGGMPDIKYLYYNQEWDKEPAREPLLSQDIIDAKNYTNGGLKQIRQTLENITRK